MKRLFVTLFILLSFFGHSQNEKLSKALLKGKALLEEADTLSGYVTAANYFERIALNEPKEWLPGYYLAQSLVMASFQVEGDAKENYLDRSLVAIQKAGKIDANAEVIALEGFIQMIRLGADPANRGQSLSPVIFGLFKKALAMEPENPRALLFLGQMEFGTAQFFGTGTEKACDYVQKAYDLFENESPNETILPTWGKSMAVYSIKNCNQ